MDIFVEPADWTEAPDKPCPITQLEVEVENFLDNQPVRGSMAIGSPVPCEYSWIHSLGCVVIDLIIGHNIGLLQWSISQSAADMSDIRENLVYSQSRQLHALNFPAGVKTSAEMEAYWERINFGSPKVADDSASNGRGDEGEQTVTPSLSHLLAFRSAPREIKRLRRLARAGRDETLRVEAEEISSGRGKVVWGPADVFSISGDGGGREVAPEWSDSIETEIEDVGELKGVSVGKLDETLYFSEDHSTPHEITDNHDQHTVTSKPIS